MDLCTGSDHHLVWADLFTKPLLGTRLQNIQKETILSTRKIYLYDKASTEDWNKYKNLIEKYIQEEKNKETKRKKPLTPDTAETKINSQWEKLTRWIHTAASKSLPFKKIKNTLEEKQKLVTWNPRYKWIKELRKLGRRATQNLMSNINPMEKLEINNLIDRINNLNETIIPKVETRWETAWLNEIKSWIKVLENKMISEQRKEKEKEIRGYIERRFGMIGKQDKLMLCSILERPWQKISIDRVLIRDPTDTRHTQLIYQPEEVKQAVAQHFNTQYNKETIPAINISREWESEYNPKTWIQEEWYSSVLNQISTADWESTIHSMEMSSAPGLSGIGYTLLKKLGKGAQEYIVNLLNLILQEGIYPKKWKAGMIFPIPKMAEWDLTLQNTRPIMLLEAARKCFIKIIQKRLSVILVEKQILKGLNFAGLPGESTQEPIYTINSLIEETKEKNKELWTLFLDIKKAFDSVNLASLKEALERIRLPQQLIHLMLELFNGREIKIITKFGLTTGFSAKEGIDQGEVISPLLWRIYFDPLLYRLQHSKLGASIEVDWPIDITTNKTRKEAINVAAIAYADDTVLLANSQEELKHVLNIAESFFQRNHIELNTKKTELVIFNGKKETYSKTILLSQEDVEIPAKKEKELTRYLGIWLAAKGIRRSLKAKLKRESIELANLIKKKEISIEQAKYINNKILLPRLDYKLSTCLLSKKECSEIQSPILQVVKWKAETERTASNALFFHPVFLGLKSLWQRHIESIITEWVIRINSPNIAGDLAKLRLKEAQLSLLATEPIWLLDESTINSISWANNFNAEILATAKKLQISVASDIAEEGWRICSPQNPSQEIKKILQDNNYSSNLKSIQKLGLWYIDQIILEKEQSLLTWQQLRRMRGNSTKGRVPNWFKKLEDILINDPERRTIKTCYRRQDCRKSQLQIKRKALKITNKKSRHEWVLAKKENCNELIFGRIDKKLTNSKIEIKEWKESNKENRKRSCHQQNRVQIEEETQNKKVRIDQKSTEDINNWVRRGTEGWNLLTDLETLKVTSSLNSSQQKKNPTEHTLIDSIKPKSWDQISIEKSIANQDEVDERLKALEDNQKFHTLTYYTDGSLAKSNTNGCLAGYSIVQVDRKDRIVREIKGRVENWYSSTRSELIAILQAILISPSNKKVEIHTDSQAAIQAINRSLKIERTREWHKTKNSNILGKIRENILTKNIALTLHKVKAHSGIAFNERADNLAKQALRLPTSTHILTSNTKGLLFSPIWNAHYIEVPICSFIKNFLSTYYKAEWTFYRHQSDETHGKRNETKDWKTFKSFWQKT